MSDLVMHSSESDEWYTPPHIIQALVEALGQRFGLDPASGAEEGAYAEVTIEAEEDGLQADWQTLAGNSPIYANYPYGSHSDWMDKCRAEAEAGDSTIIVLTKASAPETIWWKDNAPHADLICKIHQRVTFGDADNGAPFPSAIVVYNYDGTPEDLLTLLRVWGICESPTKRVAIPPAASPPTIRGHRWSKEHTLEDLEVGE